MKKMKSLKGGLAGILFTAGLLAASCTSDQSSSAVTIVNRPDCTQTNVNYVGNRLPLKPMNFIKLPVGSIQPEGRLRSGDGDAQSFRFSIACTLFCPVPHFPF